MLKQILGFLVKAMPPALDQGVDARDVLNVVRPHCQPVDFGHSYYGGWGTQVLDILKQANQHHDSWTVNSEGELIYDLILQNQLQQAFKKRGHDVALPGIRKIVTDAEGHIDYATQITHACWFIDKEFQASAMVKTA